MKPPALLPYRRDIDGLRGIAVIAVLAFHGFPSLAPWGFIGVDLFFVISGYLITTILMEGMANGRLTIAAFYARRIRRIFPALLVVLVASIGAGYVLLVPDDYARLGWHVTAGAAFFSNLLLWSESGYFDPLAATKPLLHLWSLGIEEQFYIAWPFLLWLVRGRPRSTLALCALLPVASFAFGLWMIDVDATAAFFSPLTRIWELLAGALLAQRALSGEAFSRLGSENLRSAFACTLFVAAMLLIDSQRAFPGAWAILPVAAGALWLSAPNARINQRFLSSRVLVGVGLVSYPLYLWHWPLLAFARIAHGGVPSPSIRAIALVAALLLAAATYATVERRLRFGPHGRAKAIGLVVAMACVAVAGIAIAFLQGLPQRFPPLVRSVLHSPTDALLEWRSGACFLDWNHEPAMFDRCPDRYGERTVLLWGDSQAAHLYPGMREVLGDDGVVQRTASACPPMRGMTRPNRPHCPAINERVLAEVHQRHPPTVVLAAGWASHWDYTPLRASIRSLREAGVRTVIIVGKFPHWTEPVPQRLHRQYREDPLHRLPMRLDRGRVVEEEKVDAILVALAREEGAIFRSAHAILCDESGCLARLGDADGDLTTWDQDHLTARGSRFVVERLGITVPARAP